MEHKKVLDTKRKNKQNKTKELPKPVTIEQEYQAYLCGASTLSPEKLPKPVTTEQEYLYYLCQNGGTGTGGGSLEGSEINDTITSATRTWSSKKVKDELDAKAQLNGVPQNFNFVGESGKLKTVEADSKILKIIPFTGSVNLINWNAITENKFVNSNGTPYDNPSYNLSDYIPVEPNTKIAIKVSLWGAFYRADKTKLGKGYDSTQGNIITVPHDAYYIRITLTKTKEDAMANYGDVVLPYEKYNDNIIMEEIVTDRAIKDNNISFNKIETTGVVSALPNLFEELNGNAILEELCNTTKKTKILLQGDSITHGMGATGFSPTGEAIPGGSGAKRDLYNSKSWANNLRRYLEFEYNKDVYLSALHDKNLERESLYSYGNGIGAFNAGNSTGLTLLKTTFYGNIGVGYFSGAYGIFDVFIDGERIDTVDCYASAYSEETFKNYEFDDTTKRTIEIKTTNKKNPSSTTTNLIFSYIKVKKHIELINNGVSGYQSHAINVCLKENITNDTDIIFWMAGTNDRITQVSGWRTYQVANDMCNWVKERNPNTKIVIMSANPCGKYEHGSSDYKFTMEQVDIALRRVAKDNGVKFISNYIDMATYLIENNLPMSTITDDNVHPNDKGHKFISDNICKQLNLSLKVDFE